MSKSSANPQVANGMSFIIPAHNEAGFLAETIKSVIDSAQKSEIPFEIIVVNDDSTDETASLAIACGATVIDVQFRNIAAVRNAGARRAQYDQFVFLDADTHLPAETLQATLAAFRDGYIGGGARVEIIEDKPIFVIKKWIAYFVRFTWQTVGGLAAGCYVFCTKSAFETAGGFPEEYFAAEEFFISRNLKKLGKFRVLPSPVYTSARKLHDFSSWQLIRFVLSPLTQLGGALKSRKGLEVLYEHRRDNRSN